MPSGIWKNRKREPLSEEHKRKLSVIKKGKKFTEEHKKKIGIAHKGKSWGKHSEEAKKKMSELHNGQIVSEETRRKISIVKKGNKYALGYKHTEEWKKMMKERMSGENAPNWIKDRTQLAKRQERNDYSYKDWRLQVYKRDNYKCKINNCDCSGRIIAHHILSWTRFPELRYEINNGITLCLTHHPRKRVEEKRLIFDFKGLVAVSKEPIWQP